MGGHGSGSSGHWRTQTAWSVLLLLCSFLGMLPACNKARPSAGSMSAFPHEALAYVQDSLSRGAPVIPESAVSLLPKALDAVLGAGLKIDASGVGGGEGAVVKAQAALRDVGFRNIGDYVGTQSKVIRSLQTLEILRRLQKTPDDPSLRSEAAGLLPYLTRSDLELVWRHRAFLYKHCSRLQRLGVALPLTGSGDTLITEGAK